MEKLLIENRGPAITRTNYWSTPHAADGYLHLSPNAGALRILVPPPTEPLLGSLPATGTPCEIANAIDEGRPVY
jgi:hypothetical protein